MKKRAMIIEVKREAHEKKGHQKGSRLKDQRNL